MCDFILHKSFTVQLKRLPTQYTDNSPESDLQRHNQKQLSWLSKQLLDFPVQHKPDQWVELIWTHEIRKKQVTMSEAGSL